VSGTACEWILGCLLVAPPLDPANEVAVDPYDLQFRAVMYQVLQQRPTQALIEAMIAEAQDTGSNQSPTKLRLAEIEAAFAIGASDAAQAAAARARQTPLDALDSIRLALLVARDAQRRQDWPNLAQQLGRIFAAQAALPKQVQLPSGVTSEVEFLRAELATGQGDYGLAEGIIRDRISERDSMRAFAMFNLGVALRNSGLPSRAEQVFEALADMPVYSPDALDLKERALVALTLLNQQRTASASAESALRQITASSRYHRPALVEYASVSMDHGDYRLAARIWSALINESPWSNAGQAAQVGYPICLENIGNSRAALAEYRIAETNFERRLDTLSSLTNQLGDTTWRTRLLREMARLSRAKSVNDNELQAWRDGFGSDDWLAWLDDGNVRESLANLLELDGISSWLHSTAVEGSTQIDSRARSLDLRVARLTKTYEDTLSQSLAGLIRGQAAIAERQLKLIRVGIARASDSVAAQPAANEP
jgi:hypothetical protein